MSTEDNSAREPLLKRLFFGGSGHTEHEENVLRYVIHRVNHDAPVQEVLREEYVRRNCTPKELERIAGSPELVHAAREHLWETFKSGELSPGAARRSSESSTKREPTGGKNEGGSTSPGV